MKKIFFLIIAVCSINIASAQTKVGGVVLPNSLNYGNNNLVLNGAGVREKLWIDLYAGGLYLSDKTSDARTILMANKPMAIKLHIISKLITSDKMLDAVNEGFENSTNGNTSHISAEISQFQGLFNEEIRKNDVFDLIYSPGKGVVVLKNGEEKGVIKGEEFKKALFGIWLANRPADDDLKEAMLGNNS
ncbi:chalcone isomerase family protein [Zunongwangia sp. F363]|uniref:Chalcone isomerase family protein n=1 Tax=Autumnicola tepida TaxID=3075595 RepID=A0ABU3CEH9_9FLAO|nr:chalcone isomerase family protein [Zunongwangia sp. F363]MDT0644745.1 chalcone isomerase family protein [Zunongwangia sp. F363]